MEKEQLKDAYYNITKIFPSANHGSIIITTQVSQMAEIRQSYVVQKLQPDKAIMLLIKSSGL